MTKYSLALLLTVCASTAVLAQAQAPAPAVGVATKVQGLVTVSQGNMLGNLVKDTPLSNGARVVTTSTGFADLRLDNGCTIELLPNQAVTINSKLDCKALVAGIGPVEGPVMLAGGPRDFLVPALIAGGIGISLISNNSSSPSQSLSGS
ncbi:hypothetical protein [Polaromonas sp.]|uniref:hypothetical protein n=1 Tax=Polaromonas sp. TaxID=1869339 RepID=UPI001847D4CD|nr:hypothetical protein [Polaromonas sp.]NML86952.1 hypothetical protein [Polaromonas sp.]